MSNPELHPTGDEGLDLPPDLAGGKGTFSEFDYTDDEPDPENNVWIYTATDPVTPGVQVASATTPVAPGATVTAAPNWVDIDAAQVWIYESSNWYMYDCAPSPAVLITKLQFKNSSATSGSFRANNAVDAHGGELWTPVTGVRQTSVPVGSGIG